MNNLHKKNENIRWGDWLSAALLLVIMQIAAGRLVETLWTENLHLVQVITLFGTILGLALGKSIFNRFWVIFLAFAYGLILIPWQIGLTLDREIEWRVRLFNLLGRLGVVIQELLTRKPITDSLLFLLLMSILFWTLSVYAGYILLREGNPWKVVIPGGITALIIHSFDPLLVSRLWYIAFYIFFTLLLIARMVYLKNTAQWRESHTHTPSDMGFDFSRVAILFSFLLVFFSWNIPVLAETFKPAAEIWQTASRPWLTTKDRFSFMFASLRASVGLVQNYYGNTLPLGMGSPLSDQVVMEVEAPTDPVNGYQFYWEARIYGTYEDNQWLTDLRTAHDLTSESVDLNQPGADVRPVITSTFFPHVPLSNLYTVPEPLWANRSTQAYMTANLDGTINYGALMSKGIVHPGEQYSIRSAVDAMTVSELQGAGTAYPQWVLDGYLQLPADITPRTRGLAEEIASGLSNPYDITNAVTEYLRNNIEYNQTINQPPANQERIDWFLFDYKKGFCNYYASAEVILLRSLGIPARMAVGFAQGEWETPPIQELSPARQGGDIRHEQMSEISTYVVRQKDAHAWPEVYFPGFGWIIFEPTVSQPPLFRLSGETIANQNQNLPDNGRENTENQQDLNNLDQQSLNDKETGLNTDTSTNFWTFWNIVKLIVLLFAVGILVFVIWQVQRGFRVRPFLEQISVEIPVGLEKGLQRIGIRPPDFLVNWIFYIKLPALSRSYLEINHALARVGKKPSIQDTPTERMNSLIKAIPGASTPAKKLLSEYQASIYSPQNGDQEVARKAGSEIRNLSWRVWFGRLLARFQEPGRNS
jgi:transglutaminase-like putative cysteine protease